MKKILLLLTLSLMFSCSLDGKFDDLKLKIDATLPILSCNISAKEAIDFSDFENIIYEKNGDIFYQKTLPNYSIAGYEKLNNLFKINDQTLYANYDISKIIQFIPDGKTVSVTVNEGNKEYFKKDIKYNFEKDIIPEKIIFNSAVIKVKNTSIANIENAFVIAKDITKNGEPLRLRFGESFTLDSSYEMKVSKDDDGNLVFPIAVEGTLSITNKSKISAEIYLKEANVKEFYGYIGRKEIENISSIEFEDFSKASEYIDEIKLSDVFFNLKLENKFASLPLLLIIEEIYFENNTGDNQKIYIPLKKELGKDRFFLVGGKNNITISNKNTLSGKGFSKYFSVNANKAKLKYHIISNPTDEDALGDIIQNKNNSITVDTKIPASATFKVPLNGYIKGIHYDTTMNINIDDSYFEAKKLRYRIESKNDIPIDLSTTITVINEKTGEVYSPKDKKPFIIKGHSNISFNNSNIFSFTDKELSVLQEDNKDIKLKISLRGSTIGANNKENVNIKATDKLYLRLFINGTADLDFEKLNN